MAFCPAGIDTLDKAFGCFPDRRERPSLLPVGKDHEEAVQNDAAYKARSIFSLDPLNPWTRLPGQYNYPPFAKDRTA